MNQLAPSVMEKHQIKATIRNAITLDQKFDALDIVMQASMKYITRWRIVKVVRPGDEYPEEVRRHFREVKKSFFIYWNGAKNTSNKNEFECKKMPITDIDRVIIREYRRYIKGRPMNKYMN